MGSQSIAQSNDCPTCDGTGETWRDAADKYGQHITIYTSCPDCSGTGEHDLDDPDDEPLFVGAVTECDVEIASESPL